jgi:ubiquinone/menaquinone biosynthesis C-methylase UbiE
MSFLRFALIGAGLVLGTGAVFAGTWFGRDLMFHLLPISWTGEADRLASALNINTGSVIADVGGGNGALIVALAHVVGPHGQAFVSERTAEQRRAIAARAKSAAVAVTTIEAADRATNLPDSCCDAITMRMVMHHIADPGAFARDLRRAIRPGGRIGIIDFAPGALPHLAGDHGVSPEHVVSLFEDAGFFVAGRDENWGGRTYLIVFAAR